MEPRTALIVEDDAGVAEIYAEALRSAGFATEVFLSGRMAQERLAQVVPAVVVLDLRLPQVSGEALLASIRADPRLAHTRVIVTTGEARRAEALQGQADLVLVKPVSYDQLVDLATRLKTATGPLGKDER
jgi:DNA-binding response OmpR family regulator